MYALVIADRLFQLMNTIRNIKPIYKGIGLRFGELRQYYNLSLMKLASKAGLSHITVLNIARGQPRRPRSVSLKNIISNYGTSFEWLYYGVGNTVTHHLAVIGGVKVKELISMKSRTEETLRN